MNRPGLRRNEVRRLRDLIRADIVLGGFDGDRLPAEDELCRRYGGSRSVLREALAGLRTAGEIDRRHGVGTRAIGRRSESTLGDAHGVGKPTGGGIWDRRMRARLIDWRQVPADPVVARQLRIERGEPVLRVDYVAIVDGRAVGGATNFVRYPQADALRRELFDFDWYEMLGAAGLPIGESTFLIDAGLADEYDAELYGATPGSAMLLLEETVADPDGRPFDFAYGRTRADRIVFSSRVRRSDSSADSRRSPAKQGKISA